MGTKWKKKETVSLKSKHLDAQTCHNIVQLWEEGAIAPLTFFHGKIQRTLHQRNSFISAHHKEKKKSMGMGDPHGCRKRMRCLVT